MAKTRTRRKRTKNGYFTKLHEEAIIKYALSVSNNRREASLILGKSKAELSYYMKKYNIILKEKNYENK